MLVVKDSRMQYSTWSKLAIKIQEFTYEILCPILKI